MNKGKSRHQNPKDEENKYWTNYEDCSRDLSLISDFGSHVRVPSPEKPSVHLRKARARPSLYDDPFDDLEDEARFVPPVRGYPIHKYDYDIHPPGSDSLEFLKHQNEISRQIREVSGIGYSNNLIEHSLRAKPETQPTPMPEIELNPSSSSTSSSATSSPCKPPKVEVAGKQPPQVFIDAEETEANSDPPLYEILNNRRLKMKNSTSTKDYKDAFKYTDFEKPLDINSKIEFPDLI